VRKRSSTATRCRIRGSASCFWRCAVGTGSSRIANADLMNTKKALEQASADLHSAGPIDSGASLLLQSTNPNLFLAARAPAIHEVTPKGDDGSLSACIQTTPIYFGPGDMPERVAGTADLAGTAGASCGTSAAGASGAPSDDGSGSLICADDALRTFDFEAFTQRGSGLIYAISISTARDPEFTTPRRKPSSRQKFLASKSTAPTRCVGCGCPSCRPRCMG
jgi:hypothetical protein